jgi:hypothetical protein
LQLNERIKMKSPKALFAIFFGLMLIIAGIIIMSSPGICFVGGILFGWGIKEYF